MPLQRNGARVRLVSHALITEPSCEDTMTPLMDAKARSLIRTALDRTLVVEAAAGTGKTTELVYRIVAVLARGLCTVDRLVAVTFTEKAAGELKLHLRARLEESRQETPVENGRRACLEAALARLEEAHVGTIHGFCADLLRERSLEAGVDPRFEPLDEAESQRLFRRAFDSWFEATLQNPPEGVRRMLRRASSPGNAPPRRNAAPRSRVAGADEGPVARLRQACWALAERRDLNALWRKDPFPRRERIDALVEQLREFARLSASCLQPQRDRFYLDTMELRQSHEEIRSAEAVSPRDYDGLEAHFVEMVGKRNAARRGSGARYGDGVSRDDVVQNHSMLREALQRFARDANADLAACLQHELQEAIERYERLKEKVGRLDFNDLLLRARDLLRDDPKVRREFRLRFTHLFVDEFQDTDPLQAEILLLLSAEDDDVSDWRLARPTPGKLFLVADPKQSIYRFRGADIGIYFEVRQLLQQHGALCLQLGTSFRSVPNIQATVNAAFAPLMDGDRESQQAAYVPLSPARADPLDQPTVVALPVPRPYGRQRLAKDAIESSLPDAMAAFVHWLLHESHWTVTDREHPGERVPLLPRHLCILLRRFDSYFAGDVTRGYVRALEARNIPHLLVGGRSYHTREEVETLRAAMSAIEWPDDELSVFATLRGSLFAIGDAELLEFRQRHGTLHPFRLPEGSAWPESLVPIRQALQLLASLHRHRNRRPIAETLHLLLEGTRAHAGFVLRPSGEQVLANVLHVAEQARGYERQGGVSFRGFVERLEEDAQGRRAAEAPVLEEGSEGVRIMTVHRAKGLEFPVVLLADMTANLTPYQPSRWVDREHGLCAQRLAGLMPAELLEHADEERRREAAEGVRIAYVAATRARDLLVVPTVGSTPWGGITSTLDENPASPLEQPTLEGWIAALNRAVYPPPSRWSRSQLAPGCPPFGAESVLDPPMERAQDPTVRPGLHLLGSKALTMKSAPRRSQSREAATTPAVVGSVVSTQHQVVWWDPSSLVLQVPPHFGLRQEELLGKEAEARVVQRDLESHASWLASRAAMLARGSTPSLRLETVTARSGNAKENAPGVELLQLPIDPDRPAGPRFGTLLHAVLAAIPLDATPQEIRRDIELHARILGATASEVGAAQTAIERVLAHPLLERARHASLQGNCRRETPLTFNPTEEALLEGVVDLAFLDGDTWVIVDFKTDRDLEAQLPRYTQQASLYASAVATATGRKTRALLLRI